MTDKFKVEMNIGPPTEPPANKAVGSWTCECGVTKWGPMRASAGVTAHPRCHYCGDSAELLPLPLEGGQ